MPRTFEPPLPPLKSWSWSRFDLYQQCPAKFKYQVLLKLGSGQVIPAIERGRVVHDAVDHYLKGDAPKQIPEMLFYETEFKALRARHKKNPKAVMIEQEWAFTKLWGESQWKNWDGCWLRVKVDLAEVTGNNVLITDWKTGKYREDNREAYLMQQELYATAALNVYQHIPDIEIRVRLVYLDAGIVYPPVASDDNLIYSAEDRLPLQKNWERRTTPMFNDRQFAPKPNRFCYSCEYRKDNGGPCEY